METNLLGTEVSFTDDDTDDGEGADGFIRGVYLKGNDVYFLISYKDSYTQFIEKRAVECWQEKA